MSSTLRYLRLRGRLGETGPPFLAELAPGVHRLGSVDDNDIVLRFHGVSRHHLLLRVGDEVSFEDLGSKNGTRVNGRSRLQSTLEVGDDLFIGPVRLRLEAVEADDVRLAVTAAADRELFDIADLELDGRSSYDDHELDRLERVLETWGVEPLDPSEALATLGHVVGAGGASWVSWRDRQKARVEASWGVDFHGLIDLEELFRRAEARAGSRQAVVLKTSGPPRLGAAVVLARPHPMALLLWDLDAHPTFVRVAARLLDRGLHGLPFTADETLETPPGVDWVWGSGPAGRRLQTDAARALGHRKPLFIHGGPGTGKKHLARCLHAVARRPGPMVIAGCSELSDAALAQGFRVAVEEQGTLLLEGIGDLSPDLFEAVLQLAGATTTRAGLIVTAPTAEPELPQAIIDALCQHPLELLPLAQRRDEIPGLVSHVLGRSQDERPPGLTVETLRQLMRRPWPGGVTELRATVEALVDAAPEGRAVESSMLSQALEAAGLGVMVAGASGPETDAWRDPSSADSEP
ncbi:MAG: FHA domain-containing protein [Acidobacteriota bacterium]